MKLRVIVADDELQARKRVVRLLEEMADIEVMAACATAEEVLSRIPALRPDVLVLDISMPGLGGLGLSSRLQETGPAVIFVTAHREHAIAAFEVGAVDYVMKPLTGARLAKAIARARENRTQLATSPRIAIETRAGVVLLDPDSIVYASYDGTLVTLVSALESWITTASLKDLQDQLPSQFDRVDRRHLLNRNEIARLVPETDGGYLAITRSGARVPVSRQAARALRRRLAL